MTSLYWIRAQAPICTKPGSWLWSLSVLTHLKIHRFKYYNCEQYLWLVSKRNIPIPLELSVTECHTRLQRNGRHFTDVIHGSMLTFSGCCPNHDLITAVPVSLCIEMDNLPVNSGGPKASSGWIWQAENLLKLRPVILCAYLRQNYCIIIWISFNWH